MNKKNLNNDSIYFKQKKYIILIFIIFSVLVIIHDGLLINYFKKVFDSWHTKIVTRTLAQSRMHMLVEALDPMKGNIQINQVERILNDMLVLQDSETGIRFISGVKLEMDYDVVKAGKKTLDIEKGELSGDNFLIPIYSKTTRELMGIARFYSTQLSLRKSRKKYEIAMLIGAITSLLIALIVLGWILIRLFGKIRESEQELQEKQAQLIHADRLKSLGEMAAGIAHEINQPLQVIKSAAPYLDDYFKKKAPKSNEAEAAHDIIKHMDRVSETIKNMISFARNKPEYLKIVDIRQPLNEALSLFKEKYKNHGIDLIVPDNSSLKDLPQVKMNPQEFMQIVVNLLSNAHDALDQKAQDADERYQKKVVLRLFFDSERKGVVFEVEDNGTGMNQDIKDRCMNPFYTTKEAGKGIGLGLYIIHNLTMKHGMDIKVDSIEGEGTTISILIPIEGQ